jgi:hypothetical protein
MANYVDNVKFYEAMKDYIYECRECRSKNTQIPRVTEYIGSCILLIAQNLSKKPRWVRYPFREEMINDSVLNCLTYIENYDPDRFTNPFSYFTQVVHFAFIRYTEKERSELYTKLAVSEHMDVFDLTSDTQTHDVQSYDVSLGESEDAYNTKMEFMKNFQEQQREKSKKRREKLKEKREIEENESRSD